MKTVHLCAWHRSDLDGALDPALLRLPLYRRMTALQKAVLGCFLAIAEKWPAIIAQAREMAAPLYFASAYGELGPIMRVIGSIIEDDLPVSPKDFQHSVLNAALAYLAMSQDWHQAGFALSGGFISADSTVYLASQRLAYGLESCSIVLHAHEYYGHAQERAEAEILVLSDQAPSTPHYRLEQLIWTRSHAYPEVPQPGLRCYREDSDGAMIPWLLEDGGPVLQRHVQSNKGHVMVSKWKQF